MKKITISRVLLCGLCILSFAGYSCGSSPKSTGSQETVVANNYSQQAAAGVQTLQGWYVQDAGLYRGTGSGYLWWNSANALTALVDYSRAANSTQYYSIFANTLGNANKANGTTNFLNDYNDDEGWWALAWIDAYDLTGTQAYLTAAETIFANMAKQWDTTTCGGGIWWKKPSEYKNAIANELFLAVAASLANRTSGETSSAYLTWAEKEWAWFKASGMINKQNLINDGLTSTNPSACTNNGQATWTYNQGVILGGLVELSKVDHSSALLGQAKAIANAAIANLTVNGILADPTVSGGDAPQFKGIFARNLAALYQAAPSVQYKTFIDTNASSIWTNDQGPNYAFGALWQGPVDSTDATRQSSALDMLIAAMRVEKMQ